MKKTMLLQMSLFLKMKSNNFFSNIKSISLAILIALIIRSFAAEPFNIPSGSMKPGLLVGDFIFVSKWSYGYSKHSLPFSLPIIPNRIFSKFPERGDVVVFKTPYDNKTDYIKRVIGLPGDKIKIINGQIIINDNKIYKEKTELHAKTVNDLKNALKHQELSCTRACEAFITYNSAVQSRRYEALKNLAKLQMNPKNFEPHEYEKKIDQSVNHLKKVNQDIQRLKQNHLTAQTQALESDLKEISARQKENSAWNERTTAHRLFKKAMGVFNEVEQNYQAAKFSADQVRNELSRSRRDSEMAKGIIGILEPSLQTTFQPLK